MKPLLLRACAVAAFGLGGVAFADQGCDFDIVGTWEATSTDGTELVTARYRFAPNGTVYTLTREGPAESPEWREPAGSEFFLYRLDDAKAPSRIEFIAKDGVTQRGSMEISQYDRDSFTTLDALSEPTRWIRAEPQKYFLVFAANSGTPRLGGASFAMLIKAENGRARIDAFGSYLAENERIVGRIPDELVKKLAIDSRAGTDTMLRLELAQSEFERAMRVLRNWDRRARERKMLYEIPYLNNIVFLEEMAKSLNRCSERIRLHELTWTVDDKIIAKHNLTHVPFYYIKELRQLNSALHVTDEQFRKRTDLKCLTGCGGAVAADARAAAPPESRGVMQ